MKLKTQDIIYKGASLTVNIPSPDDKSRYPPGHLHDNFKTQKIEIILKKELIYKLRGDASAHAGPPIR